MVSNKLTPLLLAIVALAFLYQAPCYAKIDEPTKVVTVSEQLQDPATKAPAGYKYLSMIKDPKGFYNYIYYLPQPAAPTDKDFVKLTFDHKLADPQQHAPYEGFNYQYYYQDKGSFIYVFGNISMGKLLNVIGGEMIAGKADEPIDKLMAYCKGEKPSRNWLFFCKAIEDLKQYHGVKTIGDAAKKLNEMGYPAISVR